MPYTLTQAAEATGKSKSTILRAIQNNRISAAKDELTQAWLIEPSELHRLYPPVASDALRDAPMTSDAMANEVMMLRREIEVRDEQLATERRERERDRDTIADLRRRLDREGEERRASQAQLTALLTDQRAKVEALPPEPPRRSWWPFGKR